jgi:type II secretory pathway pseudopilin PulG
MPNPLRRAASLIELLISFAIIGGLAALVLTGAMMLLNKAYRILD